jgi:hypothetical protein
LEDVVCVGRKLVGLTFDIECDAKCRWYEIYRRNSAQSDKLL